MPEKPVAIVTAAGRGIGRACAEELNERGYALALMSPSENSVKLAAELGCIGMSGSVTSQDDVQTLVGKTLDAYGRIDAVLNNTGFEGWSVESPTYAFDPDLDGHLLDIPDEDWHAAFDLFLLNAVHVARAVTEIMQRQGGGAIVNISASCALEPFSAYPMSSSVRTALSAFTKLYSDRYARDNIRMNTLLPGYVDNLEWLPTIPRSIPMGRVGTAREIAKAAAMLLSDDASYISGENIFVDGGLRRGL